MSNQATTILNISIRYNDPVFASQASKLAKQLNLPFTCKKKPSDYILQISTKGLELIDAQPKAAGPLRVDFTEGKNAHRRRFGGGKNQTIARAVGLHKEKKLNILDATAGLGQDSFVLANLGCQVTLLERSPIMAALLRDGLDRAKLDETISEVINAMQLIEIDAQKYLNNLADTNYPDIIYLDPMYPHRDKSALTKKEMRVTRNIVGSDDDISNVFAISLKRCKKRVVVKRPKASPTINNRPPTMQLHNKTTRYDIYIIKALKEIL